MKHPCPDCKTYPKIDNLNFNIYSYTECLCENKRFDKLNNYFIKNDRLSEHDFYLIFGITQNNLFIFVYDDKIQLEVRNKLDIYIEDISLIELAKTLRKEKNNIYVEQIFDYIIEKYFNNLIFA